MRARTLLAGISLVVIVGFNLLGRIMNTNLIWNRLDIPTWYPSFIDLRGVLSGLDAARLGYDPLRANPLDPFGRTLPYPRIWMALGWAGLGIKQTEPIAWFLLAAYAVSVLLALQDYNAKTAMGLAILLFSPAALMAYRFANLDLVIFILVALALALDHLTPWGALALLEFAAFLKLYPIVALGYMLREDRSRFLRLLLTAGGIFLAYLAATWTDTSWILGHAPKGSLENYGVGVIGYRLYELTGSRDALGLVVLVSYLLVYGLMLAGAYLGSRFGQPAAAEDTRFLDAFRIGALIYLATFVQGNSFNYRLIFLFFSVPQLVVWAESRPDLHAVSLGTLIFVAFSCWGMALTQFLPVNLAFALDEFANWSLFLGLFILFLASSPAWLQQEFSAFFQRHRLAGPAAQQAVREE